MLIDARDIPRGTALAADVCVIGAGAAGITIATQLDGSGLDVVLLESGDFDFDTATQALYQGSVVGLPLDPRTHEGLDEPRLRFFGGTTNHWAGYCRPFTPLDFENRDYVPRSGWPFSRELLDPYYERAQDVVQLGPYHYDPQYWQDAGLLAPPLLEDPTTPHQVIQIASSPRFSDLYRQTIVDSPNVRLYIHANVTQLVLSEDGTSLTGIDVATLSGTTFTATARVFVLATGGLEVARVLLASNTRRPAGIGNEEDLVGRHFMEHANIAAGVALLTTDANGLAAYLPSNQNVSVADGERSVAIQAVALVAEEVQRLLGLRSCEMTFEYPFAPDDRRLAALFPGVERGIALLRAQGVEPRVAPVLRVLCEQEPNPSSRVTLTRTLDALGMPQIALDWRLTGDDRRSMLRTIELLGTEVGRRGLGRVRLDMDGFTNLIPSETDVLDYPVNTGSHHMGTARMHASPRSGVVDPDLKVHSVANLYIGGSAVFPTSGANTPTLTIVALALRLTDHLRQQLA